VDRLRLLLRRGLLGLLLRLYLVKLPHGLMPLDACLRDWGHGGGRGNAGELTEEVIAQPGGRWAPQRREPSSSSATWSTRTKPSCRAVMVSPAARLSPSASGVRPGFEWLVALPGPPVFVSYPATFDFMFVY
jgi:hypothetical protein